MTTGTLFLKRFHVTNLAMRCAPPLPLPSSLLFVCFYLWSPRASGRRDLYVRTNEQEYRGTLACVFAHGRGRGHTQVSGWHTCTRIRGKDQYEGSENLGLVPSHLPLLHVWPDQTTQVASFFTFVCGEREGPGGLQTMSLLSRQGKKKKCLCNGACPSRTHIHVGVR